MSQSVKLADGSYFDSTGVYDTSLGMTQQAINNAVSHVGQIIFSTTLDTMEKVVAVYGGTTWSKIEGRFLIGASSSYANGSTGGEASHKLTVSEMPKHGHNVRLWNKDAGATDYHKLYSSDGVTLLTNQYGIDVKAKGTEVISWNNTSKVAQSGVGDEGGTTTTIGGSGYHNNMPPYRAVYIWERTA